MKILFIAGFCAAAAAAQALTVTQLRCENARDPLGVDVSAPRLSWQLAATEQEQDKAQSAYQILVASSAEKLAANTADLWDSGKVESNETLGLLYQGKPLASSQPVFWQVRAWDEADQPTSWSSAASWTMGLLATTDWQAAKWIGDGDGERLGLETGRGQAPLSIGYHGLEAKSPDTLQWVQVDLGTTQEISSIRLLPMVHAGVQGFGFPVRFKVEAAADAAFTQPVMIADQTSADFANPGATAVTFNTNASGRFVRVTVNQLWPRDKTTWVFALNELAVMAGDHNLAAKAPVSYLDSVEAFKWGAAGLTDGWEGLAKGPTSNGLRLRREFTIKPGLRRALLHISGLGQYDLSVNGQTASADWLTPGWTQYAKTCLYDTLDLTDLLQADGANVLGVDLVGGMYRVIGGRYTKFTGSFGPLQMIALLRLEYADNSVETVTSDEAWLTTSGPNTFSCIYGGLDYDARLDLPGWNGPGHDVAAWLPATPLAGPGGALRGQTAAAPPLRIIESLAKPQVNPLSEGVSVYDFGQNAPLAPQLSVTGPAGAKVRLVPSELLAENGGVDRGSCGGGEAWWEYTCKGDGVETWSPRFWTHGARYLQATLIPAPNNPALPQIVALNAVVVHSSSVPAGDFTCSNTLFNRVRTLIRWAQRGNLVSVISDCPHRERLGWLEQYNLHGPSLRYEWDLAKLYAKTMQDMTDSQTPEGLVPDIAPEYTVFSGGFRDSPEWGGSVALVPWQQYQWTGDSSLIQRHYPTIKRYVDYLTTKANDSLLSHGLGDWYDIGPGSPGEAQLTPKSLTATAYYFLCADTLAKSAALLNNPADAATYAALAAKIKAAFNTAFFDADSGSYATGSQTSNAMPLVIGLVPEGGRADVVRALLKDVESRNFAVTAGDIGHRYLLRALADAGRSDVIARMHSQTDRPGYGYILNQGATALTEAWNAGRGSSQNHFMLGHLTEWFYHDLAGIQPDPASPGFKHFRIAPQPVANVDHADATHVTACGPIRSAWTKTGGNFTLKVVIPANTRATVVLPDGSSREAGSGIRQWTIPIASFKPAAP